MKKLLAVVTLVSFLACSDTKTETNSTESTSDTTSKMSGSSDASGGKMSIKDSTDMLDRQLSDTTGVATDTLR